MSAPSTEAERLDAATNGALRELLPSAPGGTVPAEGLAYAESVCEQHFAR